MRTDSALMLVLAVGISWFHGATVGAALGDRLLVRFLFVSLFIFAPIIFCCYNWPKTRPIFLSLIFFLVTLYFMSLSAMIAEYRQPVNMEPLPDVLHDILPYFNEINIFGFHFNSVAFPDLLITFVGLSTIVFVLAHPLRFIILRRFFCIYGVLMLLRCATITVTSLPDSHPRCHNNPHHLYSHFDFRQIILGALRLFAPVGIQTCGDMVFSGHSMVLVIALMIWHTYFKKVDNYWGLNKVKIGMFILVLFGLLSIIAIRLHYTLDVILAIYLCVTVWTAYHKLVSDICKGTEFTMVWLIDGLIIYPAVEWFERDYINQMRNGKDPSIITKKPEYTEK